MMVCFKIILCLLHDFCVCTEKSGAGRKLLPSDVKHGTKQDRVCSAGLAPLSPCLCIYCFFYVALEFTSDEMGLLLLTGTADAVINTRQVFGTSMI